VATIGNKTAAHRYFLQRIPAKENTYINEELLGQMYIIFHCIKGIDMHKFALKSHTQMNT